MGKGFLEDLISFTLVIPTSGFGFATLIAWTSASGIGALLTGGNVQINSVIPVVNVPLLMLIIHVALTFPYIVKTLKAKLEDMSTLFEQASGTLGAAPLYNIQKDSGSINVTCDFFGNRSRFCQVSRRNRSHIGGVRSLYNCANRGY